jgi:hypothetical protein
MIKNINHGLQKKPEHMRNLVPVLCGALMAGLLIATAWHYGPFGDEFYYIECSKHLAFGYVDHPPLVAIVAFIVRSLLGESYIWLRIVTAVTAGLSVLIASRITRKLGGGRFAQNLTCLAVVAGPGIWAMFSFYSMNALDIVIIGVAVLILLDIIHGGDKKLWLVFGAVAGIGLANKMTMLVYILALVVGLLATRYRSVFKTKWLYAGAAIAGSMFLPHIMWQVMHGWPTLEFIRITQQYSIYPVSIAGFLWQIILTLNPVITPLWVGGLLFFLFGKEKKYRVLGILALVFLLVYTVQRSKVYYVYPVMPLLFAGGAIIMERFFKKVSRMWLQAGAVTIIILAGIVLLPFGLPILPIRYFIPYSNRIGLMQHIKVQRGDRVDLPIHFALRFGWRDMVEHVAQAYGTLSQEEQRGCVVITNNYSKAGAINYYRREYGLPEAVSGHNSCRYWVPDSHDMKAAVVIGIERDFLDRYFNDVRLFTVHDHPYAATWEVNQKIFVCRDPAATWQDIRPRLRWY